MLRIQKWGAFKCLEIENEVLVNAQKLKIGGLLMFINEKFIAC